MKKLFYMAIAALMCVGFASCEPQDEPKKGGYTIEVSGITPTEATIKVTPKTVGEAYYWDIMDKETYDAIVAGDYADQGIADIPTYVAANIDYIIQIYGMMGETATWEDMVYTDVDEWTYEELTPETEYVVYALPVDVEKEECLTPIVTKVFKTEAVKQSTNQLSLTYNNGVISIKTTNNDPYFFWIETKAEYDEYQKDFAKASLLDEMGLWIETLNQYGYTQYAIMSGDQDVDVAADFWDMWFENPIESGEHIAMAAPYAGAFNGEPVYNIFNYVATVKAPARNNQKVANGIKRANNLFKNYRKVGVK